MKSVNTRTITVKLTLCILLLGIGSPLVAQTTHDVTVGDNFFSPSNLTIQVGDSIRWINASGGNNHNVTANGGSFSSQTSSSFTFTQTFDTAGSISYRCTIHPGSMRGTITIEGDAPNPADLSLTSVDATAGTYAPGDNISIDVSIQNIGEEASSAASITYYASTNSSINGSDTELGTDGINALAANATSDFTANAAFPIGIDGGTYFIGAIISINDANNGNNTAVDNSAVTVAGLDEFLINEGLNDAWFNPATPGQGILIAVFPDIMQMFVAWFTYDTERPPGDVTAILGGPGQRWLTAQGPIVGDTANLTIFLTVGGVFDAATPPATTDPAGDGTMTVEFASCSEGLVTYEITSLGISGEIPIERIALDNVPLCESLAVAQ
jgi:plastocyanin